MAGCRQHSGHTHSRRAEADRVRRGIGQRLSDRVSSAHSVSLPLVQTQRANVSCWCVAACCYVPASLLSEVRLSTRCQRRGAAALIVRSLIETARTAHNRIDSIFTQCSLTASTTFMLRTIISRYTSACRLLHNALVVASPRSGIYRALRSDSVRSRSLLGSTSCASPPLTSASSLGMHHYASHASLCIACITMHLAGVATKCQH